MGNHVKNYFLAALSGLLLSCPFSFPGLDFVAWISLLPLFFSLQGVNPLTAFKLGGTCGLFHFLSLLYWITVAVGHYGNLGSLISLAPLLLLCAYLSIYPGLFALLLRILTGIPFSGIIAACIWVATEFARAKLLTGFPWCLLGYSQHNHLYTIQIANLVGVYGISFIIVLVNYVLFRIAVSNKSALLPNIMRALATVVPLALLIISYGHYSLSKIKELQTQAHYLKVLIVQPSIDQSKKWNPSYQKRTMDLYISLSRKFPDYHPDLIVWPETATPFFFQDNKLYRKKLISLVNELKAPLLFGSPAYEITRKDFRYLNRAYLLGPGHGSSPQFYDKMHLVPFGEYVPMKKYLFFIGKLVQGAGDFQPGHSLTLLKFDHIKGGILICFEAIFPEMARKSVHKGANVLINLTNDAWFGRTTAPFQHLAMAVLRAVENRTPLIRAANTGISAFVGPDGAVLKKSDIFKVQVLKYNVPIIKSPPTFYNRTGDAFPIALCVLIILILAARGLKKYLEIRTR